MDQASLKKLKAMVKRHEGIRLCPYKCTSGRWTIGWGHNLDANSEGVPEIITLQRAEDYFDRDFGAAYAAVEIDICQKFDSDLDDVRFSALVDMCFNVGINGLLGFKNTLKALFNGRYDDAANGILSSKYANQVGGRAIEIADMIRTGKWMGDGV